MRNKKSKNAVAGFSGAFRDLLTLLTVFVTVLILSFFFNVFSFILEFIDRHPKAIPYIDEIVVGLFTLSVSFAVFSWRRWQELKKETAERIKAQEELIRIANTKTETERIINKQLHVEIEERRHF
jgi:membrane protein implicated in regulation of membrane protease activity